MKLSGNPSPTLAVGIMSAPEIELNFIKGFATEGIHRFSATVDGTVLANGRRVNQTIFYPLSKDSVFEVGDVMIGIGFHWQRSEPQKFCGAVEIKPAGGMVTVVNHVPVEEYLKSVISSEMSATASMALLKAHAVISRSWVMAQINRKEKPKAAATANSGEEIIRWYDREDHEMFDVCADDHCQRYQGISRQTTPAVDEAVASTCGEALTSGGELCDARFSKCCGGVTEEFQNCWENRRLSYLSARRDAASGALPDLTRHDEARRWIMSRPESFCDTTDKNILSQVLNNYDRETNDFYRWEVNYESRELGQLISRKSGIDFGEIINLIPLERGTSGRITRLKIIGSKQTVTVGKELEIRRWLSKTHLYSSAFVVDKDVSEGKAKFTLHGAGWGHGVGLCQIGAAVMGAKGYDYRQILSHYYPGSEIKKLY